MIAPPTTALPNRKRADEPVTLIGFSHEDNQRRRSGGQIVPVEVDAGILNTLIREGRLSEQDLLYSEKIADALRELAEEITVGPKPPERPLAA